MNQSHIYVDVGKNINRFNKLNALILIGKRTQTITNILSTDLAAFYKLVYMFQNTIMPGSNLFFELSPIETKIILNEHSRRVKDENDKLQKQNQR